MTNFVKCGKAGAEGVRGYDCIGMYRPADERITGDEPRVQIEALGMKDSFYDASVSSAEAMDVPVCADCPARRIRQALKK